jgi:hypothetical protein
MAEVGGSLDGEAAAVDGDTTGFEGDKRYDATERGIIKGETHAVSLVEWSGLRAYECDRGRFLCHVVFPGGELHGDKEMLRCCRMSGAPDHT